MREAVDVRNCPQKKPYLTPPYMLGEAEVLYRDLHSASGEELKFLIMATDGREFGPPMIKRLRANETDWTVTR
jgi:hypothetical protein